MPRLEDVTITLTPEQREAQRQFFRDHGVDPDVIAHWSVNTYGGEDMAVVEFRGAFTVKVSDMHGALGL